MRKRKQIDFPPPSKEEIELQKEHERAKLAAAAEVSFSAFCLLQHCARLLVTIEGHEQEKEIEGIVGYKFALVKLMEAASKVSTSIAIQILAGRKI